MSIWPIEMIKGKRNAVAEYEDVKDEGIGHQSQIEAIRSKVITTFVNRSLEALLILLDLSISVSWQQ